MWFFRKKKPSPRLGTYRVAPSNGGKFKVEQYDDYYGSYGWYTPDRHPYNHNVDIPWQLTELEAEMWIRDQLAAEEKARLEYLKDEVFKHAHPPREVPPYALIKE